MKLDKKIFNTKNQQLLTINKNTPIFAKNFIDAYFPRIKFNQAIALCN